MWEGDKNQDGEGLKTRGKEPSLNFLFPLKKKTTYEVHPTCGLASKEGHIGVNDDPRYFSSPDRVV